MRVLWKDEAGDLSVVELSYVSYGEASYRDKYGIIKCAKGLYMECVSGGSYIIPDLNVFTCESIVKSLYVDGVYDFTFKDFLEEKIVYFTTEGD